MIGSLKDRITIYTKVKTSNGRGGWTTTENLLGTFWANISDASARNLVQFKQGDLQSNTEIIMRANDLITRESVGYARGKKYIFEEVIEEEGFLSIMAVGEKIG